MKSILEKIENMKEEARDGIKSSSSRGTEAAHLLHLERIKKVEDKLASGTPLDDIYNEAVAIGESQGDWSIENIVSELKHV